MVQAADLWKGDNDADRGRLYSKRCSEAAFLSGCRSVMVLILQ
jgi:hypothetical protein